MSTCGTCRHCRHLGAFRYDDGRKEVYVNCNVDSIPAGDDGWFWGKSFVKEKLVGWLEDSAGCDKHEVSDGDV